MNSVTKIRFLTWIQNNVFVNERNIIQVATGLYHRLFCKLIIVNIHTIFYIAITVIVAGFKAVNCNSERSS